jgi:hypothetical protein
MRRLACALAVACVATLAVGAASASAAVEFGSSCTADRAAEGGQYTLIGLSENGTSIAAPVSGVITEWKINLVPEVEFAIPQALKVFRPTPNPSQFTVVGESAPEYVVSGANAFATRIPVQTGDHLGLYGNGPIGTLYCEEEAGPGDTMGPVEGNVPTGSTATVVEPAEDLVPVRAKIEPDVDNDGYGDETQDLCPSNASTHGACPPPPVPAPPLKLDAFPIAQKGSVMVLVDTSASAPVTVTGSAKTKKGAVSMASAPTLITPGQFGKVVLLFPASLKKALRKLPRSKSLSLTITASAPNAAGPASTATTKVSLKGQAPKGHHKKRH